MSDLIPVSFPNTEARPQPDMTLNEMVEEAEGQRTIDRTIKDYEYQHDNIDIHEVPAPDWWAGNRMSAKANAELLSGIDTLRPVDFSIGERKSDQIEDRQGKGGTWTEIKSMFLPENMVRFEDEAPRKKRTEAGPTPETRNPLLPVMSREGYSSSELGVPGIVHDAWESIKRFMETGDEKAAIRVAADLASGGFARGALGKGKGELGSFGGRGGNLDEFTQARLKKQGGLNDPAPELDTTAPIRSMGKNNVPLSKEDIQMLKDQEIVDNAWMDRFRVDLKLKYEGKDSIEEMLRGSSTNWNKVHDMIELDELPHSVVMDLFKKYPSFKQYHLSRMEEKSGDTMFLNFKKQIIKEVDDEMAAELKLIEGGKGRPVEMDKLIDWLKDAGVKDIKLSEGKGGTKYLYIKDPTNPRGWGKSIEVRQPSNKHGADTPDRDPNQLDLGQGPGGRQGTRNYYAKNVSNEGLDRWENLLAALKYKLSVSPDGQWLISPDKAPRSKALMQGPPAKIIQKDPNQMEFDFKRDSLYQSGSAEAKESFGEFMREVDKTGPVYTPGQRRSDMVEDRRDKRSDDPYVNLENDTRTYYEAVKAGRPKKELDDLVKNLEKSFGEMEKHKRIIEKLDKEKKK